MAQPLQIIPDAPPQAPLEIIPDNPPVAQQQAMTIVPDAPPIGAVTPDQPAPSGAQPGFFSGLYRGMGESMKGVGETAKLTTGTATPAAPQSDDALNQELHKGFMQGMFDPHWWTSQIGHALGQSGPVIGGALAGAAAGEAVAPEGVVAGPLVGGALGGGLGNMIQTLGPAVKDKMAQGQNFNDARDSALKETGLESTIVGAMSAVPGGKLLGNWAAGTAKRAISEALINILGVQPGIGMAGQAAISAAEDKPITLDDLLTGYVQNAALGAGLHAGHVVAGKILPRGTETETPPPTPKPEAPPLGKTTDEILGQMGVPSTPPPEQGLPGVTTALPRTTGEGRPAPASVAPIPSPDGKEQFGPRVPGEQEVKTGPDIVNAKPEIIDATTVVRPEDIDPNKKVSLGPLFRGTEGGLSPEAAAQRTMVGGDLGRGVYVTPDEKLAGTYGGGPKASVEAGTRAVHAYEPPSLYPEEVAYVFGGRKAGEPVQIISGNGIPLYEGPWTGGTGKPGGAMEEALHANEGIKAVVGTPDSVGVNQIAVRDPSILKPRAQPLEAEAPPTLRGPQFRPGQTENAFADLIPPEQRARLPEIQPDQPPVTDRGLYVSRPVTNAQEIHDWAVRNGVPNPVAPEDMHATQVASRTPAEITPLHNEISATPTSIAPIGDQGALAMHINSPEMQGRFQEAQAAGATHDYPEFQPHVTLSNNAAGFDASHITEPMPPVRLGPETHGPFEPPAQPIQRVLDAKAPGEPMPHHVIDEVARGAHETNDAIGELLTEAAGGGAGGRTPPPGGGGPDSPEGRRRKLMGEASRVAAAVNAMPNDPLSFNRMAKITRWLGTAPGVAADDRTGAEYLHHVTARDAEKHSLDFGARASAKDYGRMSPKERAPLDKVIEYFDATGQELPELKGSMTLTMDPRPFGKLPWMLQLSEPGEKVTLNAKQVKALKDVRDFLDSAHVELAESGARKIGYDGPFSKVGPDGKKEIDLAAIKHAYETSTDKGLRKQAERALGLATAAMESKRTSYFPRNRYGDWTISVTPKVPMTGTGHALPGERWVSKVDSMGPWDRFKDLAVSTFGNTATRRVMAEVAKLEKRFSPKDYDIKYDKLPPRLRDELNVPMIERALEDVDLSHEDWKTLTDKGLRGEDLEALKDAIIEKLYGDLKAGFRQPRDNVPGASTDLPRALGDYIRQWSNVVANNRHSRAVDEAYLNTQLHRDPTTRSYWASHKRYNEGAESRAWSAARMVAFTKYLWGSPMSAALQLTQSPMVTGSQLTGVIGPRGMVMVGNALQQALRAMRVDGRGVKTSIEALRGMVTPQEYAGLMQAYREGRLNPVLPQDLAGGTMSAQMRRSLPIPSRIYDIGGSMFNAADTTNRVASWLAYHRAAQLPGAKAKFAKAYKNDALFQREVGGEVDPVKLANWAVNETQFMSGRMGGAPITHGAGGLAFQFQHYNWNYMRLLHKNFTKMGPQGKVAGTMMLGALVGAGGLLGLPFAKDAEQAADAAVKFVTGIDPRYDAKLRELMADTGLAKMADEYMGWVPGRAAEMAMEGPSRQLTGLDLGNRLALGNLLPGSTDLMSGVPFLEATVGAAIEAKKRFATGQPLGAMAAMLPAGLANPMKALAVYPEEGVKSASGATAQFMPSQITPGMRIARGLGATPAAIARRQQAMADKNAITYGTDQAAKDLRNSIVGQYALYEDAIKTGNTTAAAAYGAKAQQLIADNIDRLRDPSIPPEQQIPLPSPGQIRGGIMRFINPLAIRNTKALRSKQAALAASPYPDQ